jgi:Ca2+-binding EF-hand superfamily protein
MARDRLRGWLVVLVVLLLGVEVEAQGRRGRGGNARARKQQEWALPKEDPIKMPPLPGFGPKKDAKQNAPGPKPKEKTPPKAEPPPDPMKEADQVTAAADHRAAIEEAQAQLLAEHFRVCDLDASGWLSLREVEVTLSFDRGDFRRMDASQDGRLDAREFALQGEQLLARLGAAPVILVKESQEEPPSDPHAEPPPEAAPEEPAALEPTVPLGTESGSELGSMPVRPRDLLARYDTDQSGGIDASEVQKLFLEAGLVLSSDLVVAQMDPDDSGQLEGDELVAIAWIVSRNVPEALRPPPAPPAPAGEPEHSEPPASAARVPTHFGLLDPGADGFIDEADLRALQSPSRLDLRFRVLLSAMDQDGDGRLSPAEFQASMGAGPR